MGQFSTHSNEKSEVTSNKKRETIFQVQKKRFGNAHKPPISSHLDLNSISSVSNVGSSRMVSGLRSLGGAESEKTIKPMPI